MLNLLVTKLLARSATDKGATRAAIEEVLQAGAISAEGCGRAVMSPAEEEMRELRQAREAIIQVRTAAPDNRSIQTPHRTRKAPAHPGAT